MNKTGFYFEHLAPFDIPEGGQLDKFIEDQDSVHVSVFVHLEKETNRYVVAKDFDNFLSMVIERGAIRVKDYIITLDNNNDKKLLILSLHTTHDFVSVEDGDGWTYDYG